MKSPASAGSESKRGSLMMGMATPQAAAAAAAGSGGAAGGGGGGGGGGGTDIELQSMEDGSGAVIVAVSGSKQVSSFTKSSLLLADGKDLKSAASAAVVPFRPAYANPSTPHPHSV